MKCDSIILGFNFKNTEVKFGISALKFKVYFITQANKCNQKCFFKRLNLEQCEVAVKI